MGSCLSSGKVGGFLFVFYVLESSDPVIKVRDRSLTTQCYVVLELCLYSVSSDCLTMFYIVFYMLYTVLGETCAHNHTEAINKIDKTAIRCKM